MFKKSVVILVIFMTILFVASTLKAQWGAFDSTNSSYGHFFCTVGENEVRAGFRLPKAFEFETLRNFGKEKEEFSIALTALCFFGQIDHLFRQSPFGEVEESDYKLGLKKFVQLGKQGLLTIGVGGRMIDVDRHYFSEEKINVYNREGWGTYVSAELVKAWKHGFISAFIQKNKAVVKYEKQEDNSYFTLIADETIKIDEWMVSFEAGVRVYKLLHLVLGGKLKSPEWPTFTVGFSVGPDFF